jgi:hypothetical protein
MGAIILMLFNGIGLLKSLSWCLEMYYDLFSNSITNQTSWFLHFDIEFDFWKLHAILMNQVVHLTTHLVQMCHYFSNPSRNLGCLLGKKKDY